MGIYVKTQPQSRLCDKQVFCALEAAFVGVLSPRDRVIVGLVALFPIASNVTLFATLLDTNRKPPRSLSRCRALCLLSSFS